jgi:hypothetical protein
MVSLTFFVHMSPYLPGHMCMINVLSASTDILNQVVPSRSTISVMLNVFVWPINDLHLFDKHRHDIQSTCFVRE